MGESQYSSSRNAMPCHSSLMDSSKTIDNNNAMPSVVNKTEKNISPVNLSAIPPATPGTRVSAATSTAAPARPSQCPGKRPVAVERLKDLLDAGCGEGGLVRVGGRAGRHVLVDGRCLVVPGDADAAALGEDGAEVHAKDASDARLRDQAGLADGRALLRHHHLQHQLVADLGAVAGLEVAAVLGMLAEGVVELQLDARVGRAGVARLPPCEERLLADGARLGARHALLPQLLVLLLGGALGLGRVLVAGGGDRLERLLQAPGELLQLPVLDGVG